MHSDYVHEPEPYEWLEDLYGEAAGEEPDGEQFHRQLQLSVERLRDYEPGSRVIFERSPVDFLAYVLALSDLQRTGRDCALVASMAELAAVGMGQLDLLVVLSLNDADGIAAPESEDLELREAMNDQLLDLITTDPYSLFGGGVRVVEIHGSRDERLPVLERAVREVRNGAARGAPG